MSLVESTGYLLLSANTPESQDVWVLYRTDDGGATLNRVGPVPLPNGYGSASILVFSDALDGVAAQPSDGNSAVFATRDGGRSWSRVSLPESSGPDAPLTATPRYVEQLQAFGPEVVMVASVMVSSIDSIRLIYASDDGGVSWRVASSWPSKYASDLWAAADARTWVLLPMVMPMRVSVTSDGGSIWTQSSGIGPTGYQPIAASFVSATDGWAIFQAVLVLPPGSHCCHGYGPNTGELWRTVDGGRTWVAFP
jgi:photosystem II stability/assembly factor-like uncharacterized protein